MRNKEGKIYFWFDTFSGNRPKRVTSSVVKCQNNFFTGKQSRSNAFLSPQWGGIMIYNMYRTASVNDTSPQWIAVDMKPVMNTFLSQLKLLLGVTPVVSIQLKLGSIWTSISVLNLSVTGIYCTSSEQSKWIAILSLHTLCTPCERPQLNHIRDVDQTKTKLAIWLGSGIPSLFFPLDEKKDAKMFA